MYKVIKHAEGMENCQVLSGRKVHAKQRIALLQAHLLPVPPIPLCLLFLCVHCSFVPSVSLGRLFFSLYYSSVSSVAVPTFLFVALTYSFIRPCHLMSQPTAIPFSKSFTIPIQKEDIKTFKTCLPFFLIGFHHMTSLFSILVSIAFGRATMTSALDWRAILKIMLLNSVASKNTMDQSSPKRVPQLGKAGGVIKLKVKKRRPSGNQSIRSNILKPTNSPVQDNCGRTQALKRNNPFRCSPRKKPNLIQQTKPSECRLFEVLEEDRRLNRESNLSTEVPQSVVQIDCKNSEVENSQNEDFETSVTKEEVDGEEIFPLDWSLKYKVRFTSPRSFNWCGTLKTLEEGEGLSTFVRCGHVNENRRRLMNLPSSLCSFTKVWLHPSLPWLDLFPRKSVDGKASTKREFQVNDQVASCLQCDWVFSFRSVFNLLRVGLCPFFYLVANQNTMLFHAAEITGDVHVVITPTTKGLRDALGNEGNYLYM